MTPKESIYPEGSLKFIITPLDKNLNQIDFEDRQYKIDINLRQSFALTLWEKANRNPEWAIASIVTPFLTFLAGFFVKKKKGNTSEASREA